MKGNPEAIAAVRNGAVVYHSRSKPMVFGLFAIVMTTFFLAPTPSYALACLLLNYFVVDFYGAVLHVVLDYPAFVNLPIIGAGCLEFQCVCASAAPRLLGVRRISRASTPPSTASTVFRENLTRLDSPSLPLSSPLSLRWHHAIPQDIVSKSFIEVCGDLNLVVLLHFIWNAFLFGGISNTSANVMVGSKLAVAYLGQWAHRMAHTCEAKRPQWVKFAQNAGLLVSPALHKEHHTTYDDGFPILSGVTAPLISFLNKTLPDRRIWLVVFAILSLSDVWVLHKLLNAMPFFAAAA